MAFQKVASCWRVICSGEVGAIENWRKPFSVIRDVRYWLMSLQSLPDDAARTKLREATQGLPYFEDLNEQESPLYLPQEFGWTWDDFLYVTDDDDFSDWIRFRLYIDTDTQKEVLKKFRAFWERIQQVTE